MLPPAVMTMLVKQERRINIYPGRKFKADWGNKRIYTIMEDDESRSSVSLLGKGTTKADSSESVRSDNKEQP